MRATTTLHSCWQPLVVMLWSGGSDEGIDGGLEKGVLEGELVMWGRCQYYWLTLSAATKPPDDEAAAPVLSLDG